MSKEIFLTQGQRAIVDDDDYDRLMAMGTWNALTRKSKSTGRFLGFYAVRSEYKGGKKTIYMHKVILEGKKISFLNGNTLDNRKSNLCVSSRRNIIASQIKRISPKCSKFKGVRKQRRSIKWEARITLNKNAELIGLFDSEIDAAHAYDNVARNQFGKLASLNFPKVGERYFGNASQKR